MTESADPEWQHTPLMYHSVVSKTLSVGQMEWTCTHLHCKGRRVCIYTQAHIKQRLQMFRLSQFDRSTVFFLQTDCSLASRVYFVRETCCLLKIVNKSFRKGRETTKISHLISTWEPLQLWQRLSFGLRISSLWKGEVNYGALMHLKCCSIGG